MSAREEDAGRPAVETRDGAGPATSERPGGLQPRGDARSHAPLVEVPMVGETLAEEEVGARFGVWPHGGIRANPRKRCIVLVDRADGSSGCENAGGGGTIKHAGRNRPGDQRGERDQVLDGENLLLSRSKEDGYTVLYFKKNGEDLLRFDGLVEYESHCIEDKKSRSGRARKAIVFKLKAVRAEDVAAARHAVAMPGTAAGKAAPRGDPGLDLVELVERIVSGPHPPSGRSELLEALPGRVDAGSLDRILAYLERSAKIAIDGDAIRWIFDTVGAGADGLTRCRERREPAAATAGDAGRPLTWSEVETMDILADDETMAAIAESMEDIKAGRVSAWTPEDM